jgi:predicted acetyltransferase
MSAMSTVSVSPASAAERPLVENLFQFYAYDFSEFARPEFVHFDFNAEARFDAYPDMDSYWRDDGHWPLLIRDGGRVAGFALVNTHSHVSGGSVERNMAEFFVARRFRRHGVASEAVRQILSLHPGSWEIAVAARNTGALAFWPKAIAATPNVSRLTSVEGDGQRWQGTIWCFDASIVAASASARP